MDQATHNKIVSFIWGIADDVLRDLFKRGLQIDSHLYGQEINPETSAVCKADMLLKGEGENADHIVGGAEWSIFAHDAFPAQEFDFMLANPPFNDSDRQGEPLRDDSRWVYGTLPAGCRPPHTEQQRTGSPTA
jgi:type I restriction-modification system DNA methylase subunit